MKVKLVLFFGLVSLIVSLTPSPLFLNTIKEAISQQKKVIPIEIGRLVRSIKCSSVKEISQSINYSEIEEIKELELPNIVKDFITKTAFEKDNQVHTFFFEIDKAKSNFTEGVLAISLDNNIINFTYIESIATCSLRQQYFIMNTKKCKTNKLGKVSCKIIPVQKKRDYTEQEKKLIELGLKEEALEGIINKINELEIALESDTIQSEKYKPSTLIEGTQTLVSNNTKYFLRIEKNGELVLYKDSHTESTRYEKIWSSNTKEKQDNYPYKLEFEDKGILKVKNKNNRIVWSTQASICGVKPFIFSFDNDGKICILNKFNKNVWCNHDYVKC